MVNSSMVPRYSYTIGLVEKLGFELIFAGGILYARTGARLFPVRGDAAEVCGEWGGGALFDDAA